MQLELKDEKGLIGTIELPLEQIREALGLGSASVEAEAELKEKLTKAESRTMGDFTPTEKADFVINWAKALSLENKAIFCEAVGIPIAKATEAEVAEAEAKRKAEEEEGEPKTIQGKTDRPGYRYLEYLNLSVRE